MGVIALGQAPPIIKPLEVLGRGSPCKSNSPVLHCCRNVHHQEVKSYRKLTRKDARQGWFPPEAPGCDPLPRKSEVQLAHRNHLLAVHVREGVLSPQEPVPVPAVPAVLIVKLILIAPQLMDMAQDCKRPRAPLQSTSWPL